MAIGQAMPEAGNGLPGSIAVKNILPIKKISIITQDQSIQYIP